MRASPLLGGFLSVFVSSAGCSLLTSTTDLSGAGHGGVPSDAGAEGAPLEGSAGDGAADAIAARFCDATAHAFCADFEAVVSVTDGWTDSRQEVGGTVSLSDMPSPGSRSALVKIPRRDSAKGYVSLAKRIATQWRRVVVEFDVYMEPPDFQAGDSTVGLVCMNFFAGDRADGMCLGVADGYTNFVSDLPPLRTNAWNHVRFELDPDAKTITGRVNDETATGALPLPGRDGAESFQLELGALGYNVPAPSLTLHYDNVTIDFP